MIKHAHKAMETNTTGGNDLHVPRNRSGIVLRYSTTLRRVEVVFPPRLQSTCVAHDGIEDQSARTYITTIRQANTLRNFVRLWAQVSRDKRSSGTGQGSPLGQERQNAGAFSREIVRKTKASNSTVES